MKRFLISSTFFSILILTSCGSTPTATSATSVPSETSSPTPTETSIPTPSPESLLPQTVKENFETAGIDLKDMQNAKYDKNGLSITLKSGEVVLLTNEELEKNTYLEDGVIKYKDEVNKKTYVFDEESGKWGVESAATALFNEYGVDPDTYTLAEVDGVIVGTDKETGKEIFRDGRFEIGFAVDLAKKDCEPSDFSMKKLDDPNIFAEEVTALIEDSGYWPLDGGDTINVLRVTLDEEKQCWAITDGDALLYSDETGLAQVILIIHLTKDEILKFLLSR